MTNSDIITVTIQAAAFKMCQAKKVIQYYKQKVAELEAEIQTLKGDNQ